MASTIGLKRKNIDLPIDTLQKLSLMALSQGKSLKNYIESILISKADSVNVTITVSENPSPSNDPWFENEKNIKILDTGIAQAESGKTTVVSIDRLHEILGA